MLISNQWQISLYSLILAVLSVGIAASCSKNPDDVTSVASVEAVFRANISVPHSYYISSRSTRANGAHWDQGDEVGIFMLRDGGTLSTLSDIVADNYRYKVNSTGQVADAAEYLQSVSTENGGMGAIYLNNGLAYDFIAYYPYKDRSNLVTNTYPISLADQYATYSSVDHDLLYAVARRSNVTNEEVEFEFDHVLSNITINVTRGNGIDATAFINKHAVITGMPTTANFNLADVTGNTLTDLGTITNIESYKPNTDGTKYEIIILPQSAGAYSGRIIKFTGVGTDYFWSIPNGFAYEKGMRYTYNFVLSTRGLELDGDVVITPWTVTEALDPGDWTSGQEEFVPKVIVPAGSFMMGSSRDIESPIHPVSITKGFRMSKYTVTVAEYCEFLNANAHNFTSTISDVKATLSEGTDEHGQPINYGSVILAYASNLSIEYDNVSEVWSPVDGRDNYPMGGVTWFGAFAFARWTGGRLPTEAEWEYASKAGSTILDEDNNYGIGVAGVDDSTPVQIDDTNLVDYAWYGYGKLTHSFYPVGLKLPNIWGIYDMLGNIWEWCYDWYEDNYTADPVNDPVNAVQGIAIYRVARGGAYYNGATTCRSAYRSTGSPSHNDPNIGFRVVYPL